MRSQTLERICIKTICCSINNLANFIEHTSLPLSLTKNVEKKYSSYKWDILNEQAANGPFADLQFVDYYKLMPISMRNTVLSAEDDDHEYGYDEMCIWVTYYKINNYKINVCKDCFKIFKSAHKKHNLALSVVFQRYHYVYDSDFILRDIYQSKYYWCQSCFESVLFVVKDIESCTHPLHVSPKNHRFIGSDDSESDIDNFKGYYIHSMHDLTLRMKNIILFSFIIANVNSFPFF